MSDDRVMIGVSNETCLFGSAIKISAGLNGLISGRGAVGSTIDRWKNPNKISFSTVFSHNA